MEMFNFSEKLYALDVGDVPKEEIPRIIDPNNTESGVGTVVCYYPDKNQLIQLALIIWQVAARDRNALHVRNRQFETAEKLCMKTRNVFISLLLPFVGAMQIRLGIYVSVFCEVISQFLIGTLVIGLL